MHVDLVIDVEVPKCLHRPKAGSDPCDCGLWWHEGSRVLWVGAQDWLGEAGVALANELSTAGLDTRTVRRLIALAALAAFDKSFPGVADGIGEVQVEVCAHDQGKGVTL